MWRKLLASALGGRMSETRTFRTSSACCCRLASFSGVTTGILSVISYESYEEAASSASYVFKSRRCRSHLNCARMEFLRI